MKVYCTTKNTAPHRRLDPLHVVYLGTSLKEAIKSVKFFTKYERTLDRPELYPETNCALPSSLEYKYVKYYMADGWFYSIVEFELEPTSEPENALTLFENLNLHPERSS